MSESIGRKKYSLAKIEELQTTLGEASKLLGDGSSVCMTGSFGRLEAGPHSDLDLFIVSNSGYAHSSELTLSNLDATLVKADLIRAVQRTNLKKFDGDGKYVVHHPSSALIGNLGGAEDDVSNTFTSRLLLLLEGRPLVGQVAFDAVVDSIIESYWRDFPGHETTFAPAFMTNDILRLWRTFCVNYEARTVTADKLKRRVKNYKLKFSRLLTCYSALLSILHCYNSTGKVTQNDMRDISKLTPLGRIRKLAELVKDGDAIDSLGAIIIDYEEFLATTNTTEDDLKSQFGVPERQTELLQKSYVFATSIFSAIEKIGKGTKLHRMLVV